MDKQKHSKKGISVLAKFALTALVAVLIMLGLLFITSMTVMVKYGTPHYRPKVE